MTAPRLRRRALITTAAVAGTIGLAFAGLAPASAATPAGSTATSHVTGEVAPTAAAHASLLKGRVADVLKDAPYGHFGSAPASSRAAKALSTATSTRAASPSVSPTLPTALVPPARVDPNSNPDSAYGEAVLGDDIYGVGGDWSTEHTYLEHYTSLGWKPVQGVPSDIDDTIATVDGALYFSVTTYSRNGVPTATLYSYDGQTVTSVKTFDGEISLAADADQLTVLKSVYVFDDGSLDYDDPDTWTTTTEITRFDGTSWTAPFSTKKGIYAPISIGGQQFFWIMSDTSIATAIYRLDDTALTRVASSPLAFSGSELNGTFYFGGVDLAKGKTGIYAFTGTGAPTVVKVGVAATYSSGLPAAGAFGDELYYTAQTGDSAPMLYSYSVSAARPAVTKIGSIGAPDDTLAYLTEFDGKLFAAAGGDYTVDTWIYDPNATTGNTIATDTPVITGKTVVGKYLTAVAGDWTPTAKLSYTWYADGKVIKGATKSYHQIGSGDYKKAITVSVKGSGPAFVTSASQLSAPTAKTTIGTIYLDVDYYGRVKEGHTVHAETWIQPRTATLSYRWYANGNPIAGATKASYKITSGMAGKKLTVGVTATMPGYTTATAKSYSSTIAKK